MEMEKNSQVQFKTRAVLLTVWECINFQAIHCYMEVCSYMYRQYKKKKYLTLVLLRLQFRYLCLTWRLSRLSDKLSWFLNVSSRLGFSAFTERFRSSL
jgi:hypothetical protein